MPCARQYIMTQSVPASVVHLYFLWHRLPHLDLDYLAATDLRYGAIPVKCCKYDAQQELSHRSIFTFHATLVLFERACCSGEGWLGPYRRALAGCPCWYL